jgi:hypothetical protein
MNKKKIKIIALDMDGVVNSDFLITEWLKNKERELKENITDKDKLNLQIKKSFLKEFNNSTELIFNELAQRINTICNKTDCLIVWSSTWRKLEKYKDIKKAKKMFNRRNLIGDRLISYTPQIGMSWAGHCRGSEIASWINNNEEYEIIKCAVIDDREDAGYNLPINAKFFWIDPYIGITDDNVEQIINYLND